MQRQKNVHIVMELAEKCRIAIKAKLHAIITNKGEYTRTVLIYTIFGTGLGKCHNCSQGKMTCYHKGKMTCYHNYRCIIYTKLS